MTILLLFLGLLSYTGESMILEEIGVLMTREKFEDIRMAISQDTLMFLDGADLEIFMHQSGGFLKQGQFSGDTTNGDVGFDKEAGWVFFKTTGDYMQVFKKGTPQWAQDSQIQKTDGAGALWGSQVATSGTWMMVSDPDPEGGAVYIYELVDDVWTHRGEIAQQEDSDSYWGKQLAMSGEWALISGHQADHIGRVFAYKLVDNAWTFQAEVALPVADAKYFGSVMTMQGDKMFAISGGTSDAYFSLYEYRLADGSWVYDSTTSSSLGKTITSMAFCAACQDNGELYFGPENSAIRRYGYVPTDSPTSMPTTSPQSNAPVLSVVLSVMAFIVLF